MRSPGRPTAPWATVALAAVVEAATLVATQDVAVRRRSPWQDDPYNAAASFAQVVVPVLGILLAVRLVSSSLAGRLRFPAVQNQIARAALAVTVTVGALAVVEWVAVLAGAHHRAWNADSAGLILALTAVTFAAAGLTVAHVRIGGLRRRVQWDADWLDDLAAIIARLPVLGRRDPSNAIAWIRRRALVVAVVGSMVGALLVVGALAHGERWTDPWLITWAFAVDTASNLFACLAANIVAGFVTRPPSRHPELEDSVMTGCLFVVVAEAFHDQIWTAITGHASGDVGALAALTAGAGLIGAGAAYGISARRRSPLGGA